jgi:hypothetical protein
MKPSFESHSRSTVYITINFVFIINLYRLSYPITWGRIYYTNSDSINSDESTPDGGRVE